MSRAGGSSPFCPQPNPSSYGLWERNSGPRGAVNHNSLLPLLESKGSNVSPGWSNSEARESKAAQPGSSRQGVCNIMHTHCTAPFWKGYLDTPCSGARDNGSNSSIPLGDSDREREWFRYTEGIFFRISRTLIEEKTPGWEQNSHHRSVGCAHCLPCPGSGRGCNFTAERCKHSCSQATKVNMKSVEQCWYSPYAVINRIPHLCHLPPQKPITERPGKSQ